MNAESSQPMTQTKKPPPVRGVKAVALFITVLAASVSMTLLTDYIEGDLGYRQPFFIIYVAHSCMSLLMPLHLTYLAWTTRTPVSRYIADLKYTLAQQFPNSASPGVNYSSLTRAILISAIGYTAAGLMWYIGVVFAPISDVTALWSTNAFWTYIISVLASKYCINISRRDEHEWEFRKLLAVSMASLGVAAVVYGGSHRAEEPSSPSKSAKETSSLMSPNLVLVGYALALGAALSTAAWAVWYDRSVALPEDDESRPPTPQSEDGIDRVPSEYQPLRTDDAHTQIAGEPVSSQVWPASLPFGLHANFFSWTLGLVNFLFLWAPLYLYNVFEVGPPVEPPPTARVWLYVGLLAMTSLTYNAGYLVLLYMWGPVLNAVANLLNIVLVLAGDALFGNGMKTITAGTLLGSSMIVVAFGLLARDAATKK